MPYYTYLYGFLVSKLCMLYRYGITEVIEVGWAGKGLDICTVNVISIYNPYNIHIDSSLGNLK